MKIEEYRKAEQTRCDILNIKRIINLMKDSTCIKLSRKDSEIPIFEKDLELIKEPMINGLKSRLDELQVEFDNL